MTCPSKIMEFSTPRHLTAPYAILATGVGPPQPDDIPWITAPAHLRPRPIWEAHAADGTGSTLLVLGADRPLGTFLRANPDADITFLVPHPSADTYKADEVRHDHRVSLIPVGHLTLLPTKNGLLTAETTSPDGERLTLMADAAYLNLGSAPTAPTGDLIHDPAGYCPPTQQHPRIIVRRPPRQPNPAHHDDDGLRQRGRATRLLRRPGAPRLNLS